MRVVRGCDAVSHTGVHDVPASGQAASLHLTNRTEDRGCVGEDWHAQRRTATFGGDLDGVPVVVTHDLRASHRQSRTARGRLPRNHDDRPACGSHD